MKIKEKYNKENSLYILNVVANIIVAILFYMISDLSSLRYTIMIVILAIVSINISAYFVIKKGKLNLTKIIFFTAILITIISISSIIETNMSFNKINILSEPIHLGDKKLDSFTPRDPELNKYYDIHFDMQNIPEKCIIEIVAKDIDSDFRNGPVKIIINGFFVEYLNNLKPYSDFTPKSEHLYPFSKSRLELNTGLLKTGLNKLRFEILKTIYGYDDINIESVFILTK